MVSKTKKVVLRANTRRLYTKCGLNTHYDITYLSMHTSKKGSLYRLSNRKKYQI